MWQYRGKAPCPACEGYGQERVSGLFTGHLCESCWGDGVMHSLYRVNGGIIDGLDNARAAWRPGLRIVDHWTGEVIQGE
jgi:DnaJ-class molecular chaperone